MKRIAVLAVLTVFIVAVTPAARGFHALDCGPIRAEVIDEATGKSRCLDPSPNAQRKFLRYRQLKQAQEKRTRTLQLKQRQQVKTRALKQQQLARAQTNIMARELTKQQNYNRRQTIRQRRPELAAGRSLKIQEGLRRQDLEAKRRGDQARTSGLLRNQNLLEQQLTLPGADLLDGQKAFNLRLKKDQQGQ